MAAHAKPAPDASERDFSLLQDQDGSWLEKVTIEVAAQFLGLTVMQIRNRIKKGTLTIDRTHQKREILVSSLLKYEPYTSEKRKVTSKKTWAGLPLEARNARANKSAQARSDNNTREELGASAQKAYATRLTKVTPKELSALRKKSIHADSRLPATPRHDLSLLLNAEKVFVEKERPSGIKDSSRIANAQNPNPFARRGAIFRSHEATCTYKDLGRAHLDQCTCPIHIDCYKNGIRIQRTLLTRDLPDAEQKLKRVREGEPLEAILIARLYRHHGEGCPFKHLGRRYTKCECVIFIEKLRTKEGKFFKQFSLRTREWGEAEQKLQRLYDGESLEALGLGRLFRDHRKSCPYKNQGGTNLGRTAHDKCTCPISMRVKRKNGTYGTRSLFTRDWQEAVLCLAEEDERGAGVPEKSPRGRHAEDANKKIEALLKKLGYPKRLSYHQVKGCFHPDRVKAAQSDTSERRKMSKHANVVVGRIREKLGL